MQRALTSTQTEYQLTVLNGPDKGAVYRLVAKRVTIGRESECDIVLRDDPKVSRKHALIVIMDNEIEISDVSDRNRIIVNGDDSPKQTLKHNSVIQLGETKLQFKLTDGAANLQVVPSRNELNVAADFMREKAMGLQRKMKRPDGKPSLMPMIVGMLVLCLVGYMMTNKKDAPVKAPKIGSSDDILQQTATVDQELAELKAEKEKSGENSPLFTEAQPHFIKGFRDYNNGQFERATESFKACLALMPSHKNCQQYFNAAERQLGQLINEQIILGLRYKSQNQYSACRAAFQNVKVMVKVPTDPRYQEALANLKFCEAKQEGRY